MSRDEVYLFIETVKRIVAAQDQGVPLSKYYPREIADAILALTASAVAREREACALIADGAAEGGGMAGPGERMEADPTQRKTALEIARLIRWRR